MENGQMPPVQSMSSGQPMMAGPAPRQYYTAEQVAKMMAPKKDVAGLVKTIVIVVLTLVALTFIGLFIWMFMQYREARDDVDGQIAVAVAEAKDEQAAQDEAERLESEKYPYRVFSGPVDYGQLTFEYPKTWSVYVAAAANAGGDFYAYFNPIQVDAVSQGTINALRVAIYNSSFESVAAGYEREMANRDSNLTMDTITVNGTTANRYTGTIPGTDLSGFIVIFKIRDKTAMLRTDSVLFEEDFNKLLETVTFNA